MKARNVFQGLLLGLTLLLATSVFASSDNKGSMLTLSSVTVNGTTLPAGEYSLQWQGTGGNVQLSILKGSKVVATTPARLVDTNQTAKNNAAVVKSNGDGSKSLAEVRFEGKKYTLQIGEESGSSEAAGGSSK